MQRRAPFLLHAALVIAVVGCEAAAPIAAPNLSVNGNGWAGPSVTGHAEFTRQFPAGLVAIQYSLNAVTQGNGGAAGKVEFRARGLTFPLDTRWHATVLCVTVDPDGRTARVGARIEETDFEVFLTVEDNGQGAYDPPDRATPAGPGPLNRGRGALDHCAGRTVPLPLNPIERGNVQVRP